MDTSEQTTPGFGQFLKNQRLARNMELTTVSRKTKIRVVVLEQIESEDIDNLPEPVFTRGFIKSFAEAVSADDEEAIRRYQAAYRQHAGPDQPEAASIPSVDRTGRRRWLWLLILVIVLAAAAFFILRLVPEIQKQLYHSDAAAVPDKVTSQQEPIHSEDTMPPSNDDAGAAIMEQEAESPASKASEDNSMAQPDLHQSSEPAVAPAAEDNVQEEPVDTVDESNGAASRDKLPGKTQESVPLQTGPAKKVLVVNAVESCWMKITIDDNDPIEATLQPGEQAVYHAKSTFKLRLGNAGGVRLTLNGEPVLVPGDNGRVRTLSLP